MKAFVVLRIERIHVKKKFATPSFELRPVALLPGHTTSAQIFIIAGIGKVETEH